MSEAVHLKDGMTSVFDVVVQKKQVVQNEEPGEIND